MKLLLWNLVTLAVLTADCINLQDEPESQNYDLVQDQQQKGKYSDELKEEDSSGIDQQLKMDSLNMPENQEEFPGEEDGENARRLPKGSCKARNACVVLGGFCVTNTTLCSGRLVAEGCKPRGSNCTCCVPGTLETKLQNLEMELQFMKNNITDELLNQETKLDSIKVHQDEACYSPGFRCAFGAGTCRPDSCNATTENQNGTCGGVGCKCCTTKICYIPGSSCASGQGTCRPNSCNSTTEDQSGSCGGASCKCCKTKPCFSPGSSCASGQGTCRVNSCHSTEDHHGNCGGASCKCCKPKVCHSPGSSCASGHGTCRANSCSTNEYQYDTCGGTNCKCCKSCLVSQGEFQIGKQCFRMSTGTRTWSSARSYCQGIGLDLAQPEHPLPVWQYIQQKGWTSTRTWIGARGTGSCYRWLNGTCIPDSSSLWGWGADGDKSSSWSVDMHNSFGSYSGPLDAHGSTSSFYTLCERM